MLPGFMAPMHNLGPQSTLREVIYGLGIEANLRLCLDAGDPASYPPAPGQLWKDTSGGGFDFNRGTTTSVEATDPTFNGVVGNQSKNEFWTFNGGAWFTLGQANPAWVNAIHQNNAAFTLAQWGVPNFGDSGGSAASATGFQYGFGGMHPAFHVTNGASAVLDVISTLSVPAGPALNGLTMDEASGNMTFFVSGSYELQTGKTYSSPSAGSAAFPLQIGALGNGALPSDAATKSRSFCIWSRALSQAELTALFNATRDKYGA